jgi:predicted PurR-regulated permease PerM
MRPTTGSIPKTPENVRRASPSAAPARISGAAMTIAASAPFADAPDPLEPTATSLEAIPEAREHAHGTSARRAAHVAQIIVAVGVTIALLRFAEPFFVPLLIGILASYALGPLVGALKRIGIPFGIGAAIVLGVLIALGAAGLYSLSDDGARFADELPSTARKVRELLHDRLGSKPNALSSVNKAAAELERAANEASGNRQVAAPAPQDSTFARLKGYLLAGTSGFVGRLAELLVALLIAYFLLASGDSFKRKLARIAGPSLARRRVTVEMMDEVHEHVQRYMLLLAVSNTLVGLAIWGLFAALGIGAAGLWGLAAGLLHVVPYAGTAILAAAAGLAGLIQFKTFTGALLLAGGAFAVASLIGFGLQTWLNSRLSRINPVVLFSGLLFFGWLWGAWGLLLAPPLLAVVKVIAERVEGMHAIAELMRG